MIALIDGIRWQIDYYAILKPIILLKTLIMSFYKTIVFSFQKGLAIINWNVSNIQLFYSMINENQKLKY